VLPGVCSKALTEVSSDQSLELKRQDLRWPGLALGMQCPEVENRMPTIKKILFPVDFSDSCLGAARYVEALAGRFEAEIMLLHVVGMGEHNLAEDLLPQRQALLDAFLADEL